MCASPVSARLVGNLKQFIQFGIVGGSGTLVNLGVIYAGTKISEWVGISVDDVFMNLLGTRFNVRWYHCIQVVAFLTANTWNYQLNRLWTFKGVNPKSWWRGFWPFLLTGLGALVVSLIVSTLLMNPTSPIALPEDIFDDTTGFRTKFYWASAISIVVAMPVNFVINKLWTFRKAAPAVVVDAEPR